MLLPLAEGEAVEEMAEVWYGSDEDNILEGRACFLILPFLVYFFSTGKYSLGNTEQK